MRKLFACALLLAACQRSTPPEAARPAAPAPAVHRIDPEQGNLLRFERGVVVTDRTGEATLEQSAELLIDGDPQTIWSTPPRSTHDAVVFALPARTRITSVGATTTKDPNTSVAKLQFDVSADGVQWTPLHTLSLRASDQPQFADVPPTETVFLRITIAEQRGASFAALAGVYIRGTELNAPQPAPIEGCWTINEEPARFQQNGKAVTGTVGKASVEGTSDGRVLRLHWSEAPMRGEMWIAIAPGGKSLSGIRWFEVAAPEMTSYASFGVRVPCDRLGSPARPF